MSAGESAVLRSVKPHVGKENAMLPPLASPNHVLSIAKNPKFSANSKSGMGRRPSGDDGAKGLRVAPPIMSGGSDSTSPAAAEQRRILELERSMRFMKEHHEKILFKLYEEIEELKQKNRQLNFRLVMSPSPLPAHLLSPEEDQPQGSPRGSPRESPRHQSSAAAARHHTAKVTAPGRPEGSTVQLELLEGELAELRRSLDAERTRSQQLSEQLHAASQQRGDSAAPRQPPALVADLEQRLAAAETHARQLKRERDHAQKELARMRSSIPFRPPWRAGGQPGSRQPQQQQQQQPAPRNRSPPHKPAAVQQQPAASPHRSPAAAAGQQQQQQLPRLPTPAGRQQPHRAEGRVGTAPAGRTADSRASSHGSLPALPRGRAAPPPAPPPRSSKP